MFVKAEEINERKVKYIDKDGSSVIYSGGNRTWRNQNPGDLGAGAWANRHGAIGAAGKPGSMTATFERDGATLVFKAVPAEVCQTCGESYLSSETSQKLLHQAEEAVKSGVQVDVRRFVAA